MSFASAVKNTPIQTRTTNGMVALESSLDATVDLFFKIGASRGKDVTPLFEAALQESEEVALRVALWARDIRGGAGERQIFRDLLSHIEVYHPNVLLNTNFMYLVPVVGRWDDLLGFMDLNIRTKAYSFIEYALKRQDGLCAKWMPRKGPIANQLRNHLKLSPKQYRKILVSLTNVVESKMCAKEWDAIEFGKLPSVAMSRYHKAFYKNAKEKFEVYKAALVKGEEKINAGALYPYDIIMALETSGDRVIADAQWAALPNYMSDELVLPLVDVSGSMCALVGGSKTLTCLDVAVSLGLYCADKNSGPFKDMFLEFSSEAKIHILKGSLSQKLAQMKCAHWQMSTNLEAAFNSILNVATKGKVEPKDMPKILLILSDMQFNAAVKIGNSAIKMIRDKYTAAGYEVPKVVFWNLNAHENVPVKFDENGTALVSGFSPSIMKAVLKADMSNFTPKSVMLQAIMVDRYKF